MVSQVSWKGLSVDRSNDLVGIHRNGIAKGENA